jgi:hypothetical protein
MKTFRLFILLLSTLTLLTSCNRGGMIDGQASSASTRSSGLTTTNNRGLTPALTHSEESAHVNSATQSSMAMREGIAYQWFIEQKNSLSDSQSTQILLSTSNDLKDWSPSVRTNISASSVAVSYNASDDRFVMYISSAETNPTISVQTSRDGVNWEPIAD